MKPVGVDSTPVESMQTVLSQAKELGHRRSWSRDEKMAIVAETRLPGETVDTVSRRHDMSADHLLRWVEQANTGTLGRRSRRLGKASEAVAEGGFIDLGVFSRAEIHEVLGGGSGGSCGAMEIELPGPLRIKLPVATPPSVVADIVRALRAS